jgi:hypothetical protein
MENDKLPVSASTLTISASTLTISAISPNPIKRPLDHVEPYTERVHTLAHNATHLLPFQLLGHPAQLAEFVETNVPELLDQAYCLGVSRGVELEIRNNYARYTTVERQDRYTRGLQDIIGQLTTACITVNDVCFKVSTSMEGIDPKTDLTTYKQYEKARNGLVLVRLHLQDWKAIVERIVGYNSDPAPASTDKEPGVKLKWKGSATDLAEVVWALAKSRRIENIEKGKLATIPEIAQLFENALGIDLNVTGLMQGRKDSYKAKDDGLTFTASLSQLVDEYVAKKANSL